MTNYEWIKSMTIDEMRAFMFRYCRCVGDNYPNCSDYDDCKVHIKEWLESEVKIQK